MAANQAMHAPNFPSVFCAALVEAYPWTIPKRCTGISRSPTKATRTLSGTSALCMKKAEAYPRTIQKPLCDTGRPPTKDTQKRQHI